MCKKLKNELSKQTQYNKKCLAKFKGVFFYRIIERTTGHIYYIGISGNFVNRHGTGHFTRGGTSEFAKYVVESGRDFDEFRMEILDFSQFENDHNTLAPLEKYYIKMAYGMYNEPLKNNKLYLDYKFNQFEREEIERLQYIEQGLKWVDYNVLRELYVVNHLKKQTKK